jgi:hypothetical protein
MSVPRTQTLTAASVAAHRRNALIMDRAIARLKENKIEKQSRNVL